MPRTRLSVSTGLSFLEGPLGSVDLAEAHDNASNFAKKKDEMEKALFGVLYTMIRSSEGYNKIAILRIILDFLQLLSFSVIGVPWGGAWTWVVDKSFGVLLVPSWFVSQYIVMYWLSAFFLILGLLDAFFVWTQFKKNQFKFVFTIKMLRFFVSIMVTILYIPFLRVQLMVFSCSIVGAHMSCGGTTHIIYMVITCVVLVLFLPLTIFLTVVYYDPDPSSKYILAKPNGRTDVVYIVLKTALCVASVAAPDSMWPVVITTMITSLVMYLMTLVFLPYYRQSINNLLCGLFLVNFWISLGSIVSGARTETLLFTIIIFSVVPAVFGIGYESSQLRNWIIQRTVKEFSASPNISAKDIPHTWRFAASVEINMRFVRKQPSAENIQKAQNILNQGLLEYPKSCFLHMVYANLCFSYLNNLRMAFVFLDRMRHLDPPVDIRFYIYRKDTEMKQKRQSESLGGDESLDLVNYIQFQNNFKSARRFHNKALRSIRSFWRLLLEDEVNIGDLPRAFKVIDTAEAKAKQYYVQLLDRYPKSIRILRAYGQFLEEVLQDTISADQYFARADVLEESKTQSENDGNTETKSQASEKSDGIDFITTHTKVGKRDFIIIIGKDSIIRDVNANCKIFGYKANDLLGKGIETVIPDPYKKNHSTYVMKHLTTGVTKIIGLGNRRLPILCKDGHLSAMTLSVTKVTVGSDFMFVGLVRKAKDGLIATDKDGKIIHSTDTIQFLFGWEDTDLKHKNIAVFITGAHSHNADEDCFQYQKTEDGTGKIKPLGPGEVTVNIINKAGASYQVTTQISLNFVDGIAVYTWWFLRKSEKEIDEDLESVESHEEAETNIPHHMEPHIDEAKEEDNKSDFSFHRHARKGHLRMISRADSDWKLASAAKEYKRFALSRFSITIKWALLAILLLKVIGFVISIIGVETYNDHHEVFQCGQRTDLSQTISYYGRSIELDAFDDISDKYNRKRLSDSVQHFEVLHKELSYPSKKGGESGQLIVSLTSSAITAGSEIDIWSLGEYMVSISTIILGSSIEQLKSSAVMDYVHFLIDNNKPIIEGFDFTIDTGRINIRHQSVTYFWVEFALLITSIIALGAVALLLFRPSLSKIHTERNKTLELFLKIPKSAIYSLSQGKPVMDEDVDIVREERNEVTVTRSKIVTEHIIPFRESADLQSLPDALSVDSLEMPNRVPLSKTSSKEDASTIMIKGPTFKASRIRTASTESRGPIPSATFKSALLRRLTYQYITVLAITAVALFPNVLTSHYLVVNGDDLSLQNEYAAERMAYISKASLFIREVDIFLNNGNKSYPLMVDSIGDALSNIRESIDIAVDRHEDLESSQASLTQAHLNLLYSDCLYHNDSLCNDTTDLNSLWASRGLNSLFIRYTDIVKLYVLAIEKNETFEYFDWMTTVYPSLHTGLNQSSVYYDEHITSLSDQYRVIHILLFVGFVLLLIILYFVGFKSIVTRLNNEAKRTKAMILMIPESVAQDVEEIQAYLLATHDRDDEDDQF